MNRAVPVSPGRKIMLRIIHALASQPYVAQLCHDQGIAVDTWYAIAVNDALDADSNGRGLRTSQTVAAARVNRSERTVRRARAISVRIGILVELYRGRELTRSERLELVQATPGHRQRGIPNVYAVTVLTARHRASVAVPNAGDFAQILPQLDSFGHLPVGSRFFPVTHLLNVLRSTVATTTKAKKTSTTGKQQRRRPGTGLAIDVLAQSVLSILFDGIRPGQIAAQLAPYEAAGWQAHSLAPAILAAAAKIGIGRWERARSPFGLLKTLLLSVMHSPEDHDALTGVGSDQWDHRHQATTRPHPCGAAACDGYGWINSVSDAGYTLTRPCPDCPPQIRSTAPVTEFTGELPF
ncbi:MAG: hypothetical protein ACTH8F_07560 [Microbacterium sp.]|uniref:hypothetical protein n=1 Tax=Microbacterium sp. TaxID=51671 RepID=UPI003F9C2A51